MAEALSRPQLSWRAARRSGGRRSWWRALVAGPALLITACQTIVPAAPPPPVIRVPSFAPAEAPQPEPGIPADERHRIALLVPVTGANAGIGQSLANATQMALLDSRNEALRITTYDTNGGALAAVEHALADGNVLILGPLLADDLRAVAPVARRAGVPVLSFSNDTSAAGAGAYVMGYAPSQSIGRVVDYAHAQGVTSFAGLVPNGVYGERASTAFLRAVEGSGGQVLTLQTYDRTPGSIGGAVTRMATASYQAVLIADGSATAATAVPLIRRSGAGGAHILGTELWNSAKSLAGKPALDGAWFASVSDGLYRQFAVKYRARFGASPYRLSSLGYDAVLLTVRIARDWPIRAPFPDDRLRDRGGFSGIDGAFRFGRDNVAERALEVHEIRGGSSVLVSPAPAGFAH